MKERYKIMERRFNINKNADFNKVHNIYFEELIKAVKEYDRELTGGYDLLETFAIPAKTMKRYHVIFAYRTAEEWLEDRDDFIDYVRDTIREKHFDNRKFRTFTEEECALFEKIYETQMEIFKNAFNAAFETIEYVEDEEKELDSEQAELEREIDEMYARLDAEWKAENK